MKKMTVVELQQQGEELKQNLWAYMEDTRKEHEGVKSAMNDLLDLIDELSFPF